MTIETINRANELVSDIEYCKRIRDHMGKLHRLSFRFDTTQSCMESHDSMRCPTWLRDIILDAVREYQAEVEKELEEM